MAGGVSCNEQMREMFGSLTDRYEDLPLTYSDKELCTDNAAMIAWAGWEMINARQEVDIKDCKINALKKLPLGNYVEGLINVKGSSTGERVAVKKESMQIQHSLSKKRSFYRKQWILE